MIRNKLQRKVQKLKNFKKFHPLSTASVPVDDPISSASRDEKENPFFPNLFEPLHLGRAIGSLPNRVIMGSMHTGLEVSSY